MNIIPLFSTPITITNLGREFTESELQLFLSDIPMIKKETGPNSVFVEKIGITNYHSEDFYLFDNFNKELKEIKGFCEQQFKTYLEEIEGVDTDFATLRITESWLNKTNPGEHQHSHFHGNSYLSGVLYISCLPNDHINFSNRMHGLCNNIEFPKKKTTVWSTPTIKQNVTEGDFIIFPSWVLHDVDQNMTKNMKRISFSINTFPIGKMGKPGSHLTL